MKRRIIDMRGKKIGRWTVNGDPVRRAGHLYWPCQCDCDDGTQRLVLGANLRRGESTSCGCLRRENFRRKSRTGHPSKPRAKKRADGKHGNFKHGHCCGGTETRVYSIWRSIIQRCTNPNNKDYARYAARRPPPEWFTFQIFFDFAGHPPDGMTAERPNNALPYGPTNFEWASWKTQARNRGPRRKKTKPLAVVVPPHWHEPPF